MEGSPGDVWRCCSCHPIDGAPHGSSYDELKRKANRKTRRRRNKRQIGRPGAGGAPELRPEASEPEEIKQEQEEIKKEEEAQQEQVELDCHLPVDFRALLARRQQFVEEIRHKRIRSKKKDLSYMTDEDEDNEEGSLHVADADKHVRPSCAVQKYDVKEVDKIAGRRCDLLTTLVEKNTEEFFSDPLIEDYLRPQPLLALDNVTHSCVLTRTCYHRTYRTDDITETDPSYRELEPENMVQIFSLTLPETYPHSVSMYGTFAIRDVLHPGRNYLFKRSRDDSVTIHPGSRLPLCSPCRGIYALTRALLDVDLRIKHEGDDESADEKFIAGYFELLVRSYYDMRFCQRLHDGIRSHFLDFDYRYIGWSIAATVIASVDVPYPCQVTFTAYTSGFDDKVMIFDGTCRKGETLEVRHVVAVKVLWTLELCVKLDGELCYSHSFKAGVDSKPVIFGPVKALVVWSVMNRHRFWW